MNIAILGSGGREHAICQKILESKQVNKVFCIPGNAGTSKLAINLDVNFLNFKSLFKTIKQNNIDLVIVGPEKPLVHGIVDFLERKKIKVFGPNKFAAQLEGSKAFMKNMCKKNKIPTARFKICKTRNEVLSFLRHSKMPIVVKADGLAEGKGVTICKSEKEALKISNDIFLGKFKSSKKLVLEEFLTGEEASYFIVVDKKSFSFMGTAQDHKRVGEGEMGPNTGGMGAYSPTPLIDKQLEKKIINKIVKPTLLYLKNKKKAYTGFLYVGLMIKNKNPYLIEYNIRMGDPECQVILPRLKTKLLDVINMSLTDQLKKLKIKWSNNKCMTVVLCTKGYPGKYRKNIKINNLDKIKLDNQTSIFHAGTKYSNDQLISVGGRVLNITCVGSSMKIIRKKIHKIIKKIKWKAGFYRSDIGWRVI